MHTRYPDLLSTWTVPIKGKHYYRVFFWNSVEALRVNLGLEDDVQAYAATMPYAQLTKGEGERIRLPRKFGELHFHPNQNGVGTVAHEIQHLLNYWICANGLDQDQNDEEIARLAEGMTREYWNGFYERYSYEGVELNAPDERTASVRR